MITAGQVGATTAEETIHVRDNYEVDVRGAGQAGSRTMLLGRRGKNTTAHAVLNSLTALLPML